MKTFLLSCFMYFILSGITLPVFSSDFSTGEEKTINKPVKSNLYISGSTINVNAKIGGDLVAAGGTIILNDSVQGDALLGAGNIRINGYIADDIRAAGGKIRIDKNVNGDVIVAGGEVQISPEAIIYGDFISMSGTTLLNGTVKGRVKLMGGKLYLNGKVGQDLQMKGGSLFLNGEVLGKSEFAAQEITLQNGARFYQNVSYWAEKGPINFEQAMVSGKATFQPDLQIGSDNSNWYYLGLGSFYLLFIYLSWVLLILFILQYTFTRQLAKAGETLNQDKSPIIVYGIAYLAGIPVISLLLLISIVGIPIGLFALFFYSITLAVSFIIAALIIANWYAITYHTGWNKFMMVWAASIIFILLKLVALIPFAGWITSFLLIVTAFGAIIESLRKKQLFQFVGQPN